MINLKFAEAREEIEMAMDSKETVYFDEEAECARAAVKEVLDMFDGLLNKLKESEKETLQRSMGLKIEQLKAELKQLDDWLIRLVNIGSWLILLCIYKTLLIMVTQFLYSELQMTFWCYSLCFSSNIVALWLDENDI